MANSKSMQNITNRKGFTLMEMVIAMSIFLIFLTAVFNTFITITDTQRKANLNRESVAEVRELISLITDETKDKALDYSCYTDAICSNGFDGRNETDTIALISKNGLERTVIKKRFNEEKNIYELTNYTQTRPTLSQAWLAPAAETPMHSENLKLQRALFLVTPNEDPFANTLEAAENTAIQYQPNLHIILNVQRKETEGETDPNPIVVETSLSSRIYNSF